ncbi:hypothetical protein ACA910_009543 [Epithemia clementina (nom. ined.)]
MAFFFTRAPTTSSAPTWTPVTVTSAPPTVGTTTRSEEDAAKKSSSDALSTQSPTAVGPTTIAGPTKSPTDGPPNIAPTAGPTASTKHSEVPTTKTTDAPIVSLVAAPTTKPISNSTGLTPTTAGPTLIGPTNVGATDDDVPTKAPLSVELDAQLVLVKQQQQGDEANQTWYNWVVKDVSPNEMPIEIRWEAGRSADSFPAWTEENPPVTMMMMMPMVNEDAESSASSSQLLYAEQGEQIFPQEPLLTFNLTRTNLLLTNGTKIECASTSGSWTLLFAGNAIDEPKYDKFSIILGPAGGPDGNNQIRYKQENTLAIYAIPGPFWSPGIKLPFPTTKFHVLVVVYKYKLGQVLIYQNAHLVTVIDKKDPFQLAFRSIGAWFAGKFQSSLAFHRLIKLGTSLTLPEVNNFTEQIINNHAPNAI